MNYAKERDRANKKKLKAKIIAFIIVAVVLFAVSVVSWFVPMEAWKYYVSLPHIPKRVDGSLRIHYIDVGQGDATLVEFPDGKTLLIDGGDDLESHKTTLIRYMNALKVDSLDYLVVTHADADHVGGLDAVIRHKDIKTVLLPEQMEESAQYNEVLTALSKKTCEIQKVRRTCLENGAYTLSILYPCASVETEVKDDNECSAVVWLEYQGVGALFMGDAPDSVEDVLVDEDKHGLLREFTPTLRGTEILKVAHHGADSSTGEAFVEYLQPKTAVVSCGKNNAYGHPGEKTLQTLTDREITVYRTDEQGHIVITIEKDSTTYTVQTIEN